MSTLIRWASLLGLTASFYALYVEHELADAAIRGTTYTAACDTTFASCSKVLSSKYAHIFSAWGLVEKGSPLDLSNAIMGAAFYLLALVLAGASSRGVKLFLLLGSVGTLGFSLYLAYVLKVSSTVFEVLGFVASVGLLSPSSLTSRFSHHLLLRGFLRTRR